MQTAAEHAGGAGGDVGDLHFKLVDLFSGARSASKDLPLLALRARNTCQSTISPLGSGKKQQAMEPTR